MSEWRPIEAAPKNTEVDLWIPEWAEGNRSGRGFRVTDCIYANGEWNISIGVNFPWLQGATHWMPIPEPPET